MKPSDYERIYCETLLEFRTEAERRGLTFREAMLAAVNAWLGTAAPDAAALPGADPLADADERVWPEGMPVPQPPRSRRRKTERNGNAGALLASLRAQGPASNPELSRRTGIPLDQVASAVGGLVRYGSVRATKRQDRRTDGKRGRRFTVWEVTDAGGAAG